ncbi:TIR domain-containing protein [Zoogloea sp.]|uniref:TIR domain-containing protein n=1 Tax=Zoogloea sp. TaxID=49181 RepID=UPI0035ADA41B
MPAPKYAAFISYRHTDYNLAHARSLETALRRYAKPLWRPPISIFRDDRVLKPGDDLPRVIRKALVGSEFLLYLATKDAGESTWVQDELRIWCAELRRADRLIIVHVSDSIEVDVALGAVNWERTDALPALLKPYVSSIPVWVDLSWASKDAQRDLLNADYRGAVNAITARFRNLEPGVMSDGEVITHRRNVRLRNGFTAVILASMVAAIYFGDQARRDRSRAEAAAESEKEQRQRAEVAAEGEKEQRKRAEEAQRRAEEAQRRAEEQRTLAEERTRQVELGEAYRLVTHGNDSLRRKDADRAQCPYRLNFDQVYRLKFDQA